MKQTNYHYDEIYPCNNLLKGFLEDLDSKIKLKPNFVREIETILGFMQKF